MAGILDSKVSLVTGGGSGIGRASCLAFSREGAKVVVVDMSVEGGEESVSLIKEDGGDAIFVRTDVSKAVEVEAMVKAAAEAYGRLDYAFNNAGVVQTVNTSIVDCSEEDWDLSINVNLKGVWLCMKYEIPQMLKSGGGAVVNSSSILGIVAKDSSTAYTASKHGVVGLTKTAALQYAKENVRVNGVGPGYTRTPMIQERLDDPEWEATFTALHPLGRMGLPEDVAEAVIWLCSDKASFVTGHILMIDGGYVAQ